MKSRECLLSLFLNALFLLYIRKLHGYYLGSFAALATIPYCPIFTGQTATHHSLSLSLSAMAPVYLNPPHDSHTFQLDDKKEDQHLQLLNSSQDQRIINLEESHQQVDHGGSSDLQVSAAYSSNKANKINDISNQKLLPLRKREVGEGSPSDNGSYSSSAKWMPSKMRLMQNLMNSSSSTTTHMDDSVNFMQKLQCHDHQLLHDDSIEVNSFSNCSNTTIRVCSDCNTTTTPLWRSGPRGPKSLCNACGIRKRKARRAMEAAAAAAAAGNGTTTATDGSFTKIKLQIKDKKQRTSHVGQYKKQCKSHESDPPHHHQYQSERNLCFKDFALRLSNNSALKQVFAQDVEEAAILLMELSCGFIQT